MNALPETCVARGTKRFSRRRSNARLTLCGHRVCSCISLLDLHEGLRQALKGNHGLHPCRNRCVGLVHLSALRAASAGEILGKLMTTIGILQIAVFLGLVLVCAKPLGSYMARVFE